MGILVRRFEEDQAKRLAEKNPVPLFFPGDIVRVSLKIVGSKHMQVCEGVCIARKGGGINSSFIVRKISFGEGVERGFPLFSPSLRIEVIRHRKVRRAKLYYLRGQSVKQSRFY